MSVLARSSSASIDPRRVFYAALAALVVSLTLLHFGFYQHRLILDTVEYHRYGTAIAHGDVPYRDFRIEYPPGALPMFALPAVGEPGFSEYQRQFQVLLGVLAGATLLGMASVLVSLGATTTRLAGALGFFALSPLVLGSVVIYRYDLWPAALAVGGLAGILAGRERWGFASLGLGIAAKIFPAVIVPTALAYVWRTRGRREALVCLGIAAAVVAVFVVPFLAVAPHGVLGEHPPPGVAPTADREPRLGVPARGAPASAGSTSTWSPATDRRTSPAPCRGGSAPSRPRCSC